MTKIRNADNRSRVIIKSGGTQVGGAANRTRFALATAASFRNTVRRVRKGIIRGPPGRERRFSRPLSASGNKDTLTPPARRGDIRDPRGFDAEPQPFLSRSLLGQVARRD